MEITDTGAPPELEAERPFEAIRRRSHELFDELSAAEPDSPAALAHRDELVRLHLPHLLPLRPGMSGREFLAAAAPQFYERAGRWLSDFSKG